MPIVCPDTGRCRGFFTSEETSDVKKPDRIAGAFLIGCSPEVFFFRKGW